MGEPHNLIQSTVFPDGTAISHKLKCPDVYRQDILKYFGGELGIRTPGPVTVNSFQDCRNRPLCQLSGGEISTFLHSPKTFLNINASALKVRIINIISRPFPGEIQ